MSDPRVLTLEAVLDDWISDLDMQGDFQSQGLERTEAFAAMVRQALGWIHCRVLVPGDLVEQGFVPWPGTPERNARRFADSAAGMTEVTLPGDICWFDLGPAAREELTKLST